MQDKAVNLIKLHDELAEIKAENSFKKESLGEKYVRLAFHVRGTSVMFNCHSN